MPSLIRRQLLPVLIVLAACLGGCAWRVNQPDTPARHFSYMELNQPAPPGERYYLLVFGAQSTPKIPRYTHTWVTAVRARDVGRGVCPAVEHHSISWMPATLYIRTWLPCVEPGVNLTLHESIQMAMGYCERVSLWGPYEIPPGVYRKFLIQKDFIDSGAIGYQCIDTIGEAARTGDGSNCIHAISDADAMFSRQAYPLWTFGDSASTNILRQLILRGVIRDVEMTHDWLVPALRLDQYPIVRRAYQAPWFPEFYRFRMMRGRQPDAPGGGLLPIIPERTERFSPPHGDRE
jgi:hypothetical protein